MRSPCLRFLIFLLFVFAPTLIVSWLLRRRLYLDFSSFDRLEEMSVNEFAILRVVQLDFMIRTPLAWFRSIRARWFGRTGFLLRGVLVPMIPSLFSHDNRGARGFPFVHCVHITPLLVGFAARRMLARFLTGVVHSGGRLFFRRFFRRLSSGIFLHSNEVVGLSDSVRH